MPVPIQICVSGRSESETLLVRGLIGLESGESDEAFCAEKNICQVQQTEGMIFRLNLKGERATVLAPALREGVLRRASPRHKRSQKMNFKAN